MRALLNSCPRWSALTSWTKAQLDDCLDALLDYRGKSPKKSTSGIPVLSAKVVKTAGLLRPIEQTISPDYYETWMTRGFPKPDDVVMTTEAPLGEVIQLDEETSKYALGQRIVCMRGKTEVLDSTFLRYLLTSPKQQANLAASSTGTTVLGISQKALRKLEISFPEMEEQVAIGKLLRALDDKIELNRRMNETLEEMARELFRDWLVDFGPTRRQIEGATNPVAIMGGAFPAEKAASLAPLFPAAFGEDGLPEGWESGEVADLADLNPKSWTARKHPQNVEYVDLSNTKWGRIEETTNYDWGEAPSRARRVLEIGDTIVGTVRPGNGSYSLVGREGLTGSTGFAVLRPKQGDAVEFVYCALTSPENIEGLANLADGGAYPAINPKVVAATGIALADQGVMSVFSEVTRSMFAKRHANEQESQTLAEMRDLLLPKLMSGEIRVGNVEATR